MSTGHASSDRMHLHPAGQMSPRNFPFDYGSQACSVRHFAVAEIKLIMEQLLHEYKFMFPDWKQRPKVMYVNDFRRTYFWTTAQQSW